MSPVGILRLRGWGKGAPCAFGRPSSQSLCNYRSTGSLILPKADYQELDENPPDIRPIVNINQRGEMIFKLVTWYDPAETPDDPQGIDDLLQHFKEDIVPESDLEETTIGATTMVLVNTPILIRADKWTEWHHITKLMERCSQPAAAFWKLELAMSEQDKEDKMLKAQGRSRR